MAVLRDLVACLLCPCMYPLLMSFSGCMRVSHIWRRVEQCTSCVWRGPAAALPTLAGDSAVPMGS